MEDSNDGLTRIFLRLYDLMCSNAASHGFEKYCTAVHYASLLMTRLCPPRSDRRRLDQQVRMSTYLYRRWNHLLVRVRSEYLLQQHQHADVDVWSDGRWVAQSASVVNRSCSMSRICTAPRGGGGCGYARRDIDIQCILRHVVLTDCLTWWQRMIGDWS